MKTEPHKSQFKPHVTLAENTLGRDFIVSDLHGYRECLDQTLKEIDFSYRFDRLISVGDLIDRGPNSVGCLELLSEPWFWAVRGNHEQMLIEAIIGDDQRIWRQYLLNGGDWILKFRTGEIIEWCQSILALPYTYTLPVQRHKVGICHAEYQALNWSDRLTANDEFLIQLLWGRTRIAGQNKVLVRGIDYVFSGHTVVPKVQVLGNSVFIDRGVYLNNSLTVLDLQQWLDSR